MLRNILLLRVLSALAIGLAVASFPGLGYAAGPYSLPAAGLGSVVLVNQDTGPNEMLSVNFAGTTYTVAPQGSSSSNQVEFNIPPGTYSYTASVAGIGSVTGSVTIPQGRVISLAFVDNTADLANGDQNADDQPVLTQQVVTDNDDENAESDNDKDNDESEEDRESSKVQAEENELHEEVKKVSESNETAAEEAAEHDTVANNDDGIKPDLGKDKNLTTDTGKTTNPLDPGKGKNLTTDTGKAVGNPLDPGKGKNVTTDTGKVTNNTFDPGKGKNLTTDTGKGKNVTTDAGKTTNTFNTGKGKNLTTGAGKTTTTFNTGKVTKNTLNTGKGKNLTTNAGKNVTVPFNPGKITNFNTNVGKPNTNTFNPGKSNVTTHTTNHANTNNSTITGCVPGSLIYPACSKNNSDGHNQGKSGKSGKKGDFLTISYTPADSGATLTVANDGGKHDSDDDGDNESSEQTVTTVVTPAFDNDELIVTITDVTAQAQ